MNMKEHYLDKQMSIQINQRLRETHRGVQNALIPDQSSLDLTSIFLVQNKGKGPPGRTRSPGAIYSDHLCLAFRAMPQEQVLGIIKIENQLFTNTTKNQLFITN
jgi:hypothetical protein